MQVHVEIHNYQEDYPSNKMCSCEIKVDILLFITSVILSADKVLCRSEETRQLYSILKPARKRSWRLRVSWLVIYWLLCWTTILLKNWFDYTHYRFGNLGLVVTKIKFHKNLQLDRFTPKTCRIWDIRTQKDTNLGTWDLGRRISGVGHRVHSGLTVYKKFNGLTW